MGILRTKGFANRDMMTQKIIDTIMEIEEETGVYCEIEVFYAYPGVINHDEETALAEKAAKKVLSAENVKVMEEGTMTSEDFGYFLLERPGSFYHIGVESEAGLHSPRFNPDESAIAKAAAVHAAVLTEYLEEHKEK